MYRSLLHSPGIPLRGLRTTTTATSLPTAVVVASTSANLIARSNYATQSSLGGNGSGPTRKQISVMTDDGRYSWDELSGREKVARATQQSFNFLIVVIGVVMTVRIPYTHAFY
jgi:mitochondrial import inner membrane translocase subunit TIM21